MSPYNGEQDGQSQPEGDIENGKKQEGQYPQHLFRLRGNSYHQQADGTHENPQGKYHKKNRDKACHKLSVDHHITIDRLRGQPVQCPQGTLPVHTVKAQDNPCQRAEKRQKGAYGRQGISACGKQGQENKFTVFRSLIPDITERPVQAGHTSQSQQRSHQQETGAAQMVGQFLPEQDKESVDRTIFLFPMHAGQGS